MRQLVHQVCYARYHVSFYLWWIGLVLKHWKVPKYYHKDFRKQKYIQSRRQWSTKIASVNVIRKTLWIAWNIFLKSVAESIFSKASSLCYKWQWRSLWCSLVLVTFKGFPLNMKVLSKMTVTEFVPESISEGALGLTMSGNDHVFERFCGKVFPSLRLWWSLFKVKVVTENGSDLVIMCV